MSELQRYKFAMRDGCGTADGQYCCLTMNNDGDYVLFTDHLQELERMRALLRDYIAEHLGEYPVCTCDLCKRADAILEEPK
jgi:hypothetical protein